MVLKMLKFIFNTYCKMKQCMMVLISGFWLSLKV